MAARKIDHPSVDGTDQQNANDRDPYADFANIHSVDDQDDDNEDADYGADDFDDEEDLDEDIDDEDREEEEGLDAADLRSEDAAAPGQAAGAASR